MKLWLSTLTGGLILLTASASKVTAANFFPSISNPPLFSLIEMTGESSVENLNQNEDTKTPEPSNTTENLVDPSATVVCPTDIGQLAQLMVEYLPGYINRVKIRQQVLTREAGIVSYTIVAGRVELEPLPVSVTQYNSISPQTPEQVFFTTLEREYVDNRLETFQNYHWLFLTQTDAGWRLVLMYTRFGVDTETRPPLPPQESSNTAVGQAVQLWLRDCRAGTLRQQ